MTTESTIVAGLATAALGAASGSFLNVLVERTRAETSPWVGRSVCPKCGRTLSWFEIIPVLSWVALGGKCRTCRTRIAVQYIAMEIISAGVFLLIWLSFGWSWLTVLGWGIGAMMIALALYDGKWALLPDEWSYTLAILGAITAWYSGIPALDILLGAIIGAGFFGGQWLLSRGQWVGSGDILLGLALGVLLGWRMFGLALLLGYFSGAIVAALQILRHKLSLQNSMPFGPYLVAGGFTAWLFGQQIVDWYFYHAIFR